MTNQNFKDLKVGSYYILSSIDTKKCSVTNVGLFTKDGFTSITPYFNQEHVLFEVGSEVIVNIGLGYGNRAFINGIQYA